MCQVIGMISFDKGIKILVSIWVVVKDNELLSITVLGEEVFVTKSGVNIVSPFI